VCAKRNSINTNIVARHTLIQSISWTKQQWRKKAYLSCLQWGTQASPTALCFQIRQSWSTGTANSVTCLKSASSGW